MNKLRIDLFSHLRVQLYTTPKGYHLFRQYPPSAMRFESVKGSYDGYEYDMRDSRYKPVRNKKKLGLIAIVIGIIILSIVLIRKQPTAHPEYFRPVVGSSYYHQRTGDIDMNQNVEIYSIPLFSGDKIKDLKSKGKKVTCQYSVGLWKEGQPELDKKYLGKQIENNAFAMDVRQPAVQSFIASFVDKASQFGCDGFEPLDMNVFSQDNDLDLSIDDQLKFSRWLADKAHSKGLFTGLVDAVLQLSAIDVFDYALTINCMMTNNCPNYSEVIAKGKPVFDMETSLLPDKFCDRTNSLKFYAFTKPSDFGPGAEYCQK